MYFFRRKSTSLFFISLYLAYGIIADFFLNKVIDYIWKESFSGFRIYTIAEYIFLSLFLNQSIKSSKSLYLIKVLSILFILYTGYDFLQPHSEIFDSIPAGISSLLIILYCNFYFFEKLHDPKIIIYNEFTFWIVASLVLYFSGTFFLFVFYNYYKSKAYVNLYSLFNGLFIVVRNILFLIGVCLPFSKKSDFST